MKSKAKWQKIGWRSLRHNGEPRMLFRFNRHGVCVSHKFVRPKIEGSFGRIAIDVATWQVLRREAETEWQKLQEVAE